MLLPKVGRYWTEMLYWNDELLVKVQTKICNQKQLRNLKSRYTKNGNFFKDQTMIFREHKPHQIGQVLNSEVSPLNKRNRRTATAKTVFEKVMKLKVTTEVCEKLEIRWPICYNLAEKSSNSARITKPLRRYKNYYYIPRSPLLLLMFLSWL